MKIDNLEFIHILLLGMLPTTVFSAYWTIHEHNDVEVPRSAQPRPLDLLYKAVENGDLRTVERLIENDRAMVNERRLLYLAVEKT